MQLTKRSDMGIRLSISSLIVILILTSPVSAPCSNYSARIQALGGSSVAGIIPDTLTDIFMNAAYLSLKQTRDITLEINDSYSQYIYFPAFRSYFPFDMTHSFNANKVILEGMKFKGWSTGFTVIWHQNENQKNTPSSHQNINSSNELSCSVETIERQDALNFWSSSVKSDVLNCAAKSFALLRSPR